MTVWTQKWSLSNCGLSRPHEIITEKIWKKRLVLKDRPAAIIVGKCMYENTWNSSFVVTYLLVWKKVILTFFFLFLVWSIYRIFFLLATTNITKKVRKGAFTSSVFRVHCCWHKVWPCQLIWISVSLLQ